MKKNSLSKKLLQNNGKKKKAEEKKTKEEEKSGLSKGTIKNFPTPNEGQIRELMDDWDSFDNNEQRNQLKLDTELLITAAAVSGAVVFLKMSKTGLKRIAPIAIIPALLLSAKASGSVCKSPHFFENLANSELYKLHHCLDVSPELRLQFAYAYHANKINKEKKKRNKLEIKD